MFALVILHSSSPSNPFPVSLQSNFIFWFICRNLWSLSYNLHLITFKIAPLRIPSYAVVSGDTGGTDRSNICLLLVRKRVLCLMPVSHPDSSESVSQDLHGGHRKKQCNRDRVSSGREAGPERPWEPLVVPRKLCYTWTVLIAVVCLSRFT